MATLDPEQAFADLLREVDRLLPSGAAAAPGPDHSAAVAELLAFLGARMQELEARKERERKQFLEWLEGQIGVAVEDLSGKTLVAAYDRVSEAELLRTLERNHPARVRETLAPAQAYGASNPLRERIRQGRARSVSLLQPIEREIVLTDRLIDLVVYRLYRLTPAEIAVIEARDAKQP